MERYLNQAIQRIKPGSEYTFKEADYSTIDWIVLEGKAPTEIEINAIIEEIKAEELAQPAAKAALLDRLGITAEEAKLLLS